MGLADKAINTEIALAFGKTTGVWRHTGVLTGLECILFWSFSGKDKSLNDTSKLHINEFWDWRSIYCLVSCNSTKFHQVVLQFLFRGRLYGGAACLPPPPQFVGNFVTTLWKNHCKNVFWSRDAFPQATFQKLLVLGPPFPKFLDLPLLSIITTYRYFMPPPLPTRV